MPPSRISAQQPAASRPATDPSPDLPSGEELVRQLRAGELTGPVNLAGARLIDADLSELDLTGACLAGAELSRANFEGTILLAADLTRATLFEARLTGAELSGARLDGANLEGATLVAAGLGRASLRGASLVHADLSGASLVDADLEGANLSLSTLTSVRARGANWAHANLKDADLHSAELDGGRMSGAVLDGADLRASHMRGLDGFRLASWLGVDIREIDFTGAYLCRSFIHDQNYLAEFRAQGHGAQVLYCLWRLTSDCGRSAVRWAACTGLLVFLFALAYTSVPLDYGSHHTAISPLYFSVVTMTTLGFGDVVPITQAGQWLVMIEVITGYVMLGGLLSIFSNKMASRAD